MEHTLILKVPDEVYEPLAQKAKQAGQSLEKIAQQWLANIAQSLTDDPLLRLAGTFEAKAMDDPLEKFIGAFKSPVHDWVDQHDKYIGQAVMASHDEDQNGA